MKVLMVAPRAYPMTGGVEKHIHELSKELVKQGDEVTVVTHKMSTDVISLAQIVDGVRYEYYNVPFNNYYMISEELVSRVVQNADKYDVVHLQAIHKPLSMLMLWRLRKAKVKIVFTPHYHGGGHTGLANFAHIFYRKLSSLVIGRADSVIAVSDGEAELIKEHFPQLKDKIAVIPNGVVQPAKQKPFEKENPVLLTVSRLEPYKRIDKIIEELPEGLQLVIVGAGKDYDRLQQLATDLRKDVVLTGGISDDELNRWWNTADTFISLSEKEAYGLTFGEAMSMGLPCIVSDIPSYHFVYDLFEKPSGVVFYREKQDFMRQYTSAVADKTSKSKATVFTWDKAAEELSQIYKEMI